MSAPSIEPDLLAELEPFFDGRHPETKAAVKAIMRVLDEVGGHVSQSAMRVALAIALTSYIIAWLRTQGEMPIRDDASVERGVELVKQVSEAAYRHFIKAYREKGLGDMPNEELDKARLRH